MPQQPSPQPVQSGLAYTTVGCDLKSCRSIYYSHPRTLSKVDWHYYGGILDASTTPLSKGSKITKISSCRPGLGMLRSSNLAVVYTNRSRRSPAAGRRRPPAAAPFHFRTFHVPLSYFHTFVVSYFHAFIRGPFVLRM